MTNTNSIIPLHSNPEWHIPAARRFQKIQEIPLEKKTGKTFYCGLQQYRSKHKSSL